MKTLGPLKHIEEKIRKQRMMMEKKEEKEDEQEIVS